MPATLRASNLRDKAKRFACASHGGMAYGVYPYSYHLQRVEDVLVRFGVQQESLLAAAWLHDVVEDTPVTIDDVQREFSDEVAQLVTAVTDEPGKNRKERKASAYPKIRAAGPDAVALKLADRIANVEASIESNASLLEMYRRGYPAFREVLRVEGELDAMWTYLDSLFGDQAVTQQKT